MDEAKREDIEGVETLAPLCLHYRDEVDPGQRFCLVVL
jgi:hypothetical protein